MKLLFLDIDGVLNQHNPHPNGYSPIMPCRVEHLNSILAGVPDVQIVLSSAWRYSFPLPRTVETLLCVHGVNCAGRIHGVTDPDPVPDPCPSFEDREWWSRMGMEWRRGQVLDYALRFNCVRFAVLDDLPLPLEHLFLTCPQVGLTAEIAAAVVQHFALGEEAQDG